MRASDVRGHTVMGTADAVSAGKVDRVVVDAERGRVIAFVLKKTPGDADVLMWESVTSVGPDAVTVADASALVQPDGLLAELTDKKKDVMGARVLTDAGDELGEVDDVEFDPKDGRVLSVSVKASRKVRSDVSGDRLLGLGSYALVVRA